MRDDTCSTRSANTHHRLRRYLSYTILAIAFVIFGWQAHIMRMKFAADQEKRILGGFWERAVEDAGSAIVAVEADTELVVDWNRGSERMLGWTPHEVVGSRYDFLLPEDVRSIHNHLMSDKDIRTELLSKVATINCWVYTKRGSPKSVLVRVRGMSLDGHYYYIVTFDEQRNLIKLPDTKRPPAANTVEPKPEMPKADVKKLLPLPKD